MGRRRITALIMAVGMLVVSTGIPLPAPRAAEVKADEDFPCRYHNCGCLTAEQCRTLCCCFKPAEPVSCCAADVGGGAEADVRPGVSAISALACRGQTPWSFAAVPPVVPDSIVRRGFRPDGLLERMTLDDMPLPSTRVIDVIPPPPRRVG